MAPAQLVAHEVHAPDLVATDRLRLGDTGYGAPAAFGLLGTQRQALLIIEPVDPLRVDVPSFAAQEHMQPPVAVLHPCLGEIP